MNDQPPEPGPGNDAGGYTGTPRWVYGFAVVAAILIVIFVILHLTGRGFRGHAP
jgi:hypothetical protein